MKFKKFSSLNNTYKTSEIEKASMIDKNVKWMVTEKVHGANFSFWYDTSTGDFKVASRTQFVDGSFFSCTDVIERYKEAFTKACDAWVGKNSNLEGQVITLYGELFGGNIQKEVQYGVKDFISFDLRINGEVMSKDLMVLFSESAGIKTAPILADSVTLEEALLINNEFKSLLTPFGVDVDNFAEGVVIEPVTPCWDSRGNRIYLKNKTKAFTEKNSSSKPIKLLSLSESDNIVYNTLLELVCNNRVNNVISKIGEVSDKDFGKVLKATIEDLLEESEVDMECLDNKKTVSKMLTKEVSKTVREVLIYK